MQRRFLSQGELMRVKHLYYAAITGADCEYATHDVHGADQDELGG